MGLRTARRWKALAPLCFAAVKEGGQNWYVGLKSVFEENGELFLILTLPPCAVSRQALLEAASVELRHELEVHSVSVGRMYGRHADLRLTVRDMTQDVREAAL